MSEEVLHSARPQGETTLAKALTLAYPMLWQPTIASSSWGRTSVPSVVSSASRTASKPSLVAVESSIRR